jgi:hypothetical protein
VLWTIRYGIDFDLRLTQFYHGVTSSGVNTKDAYGTQFDYILKFDGHTLRLWECFCTLPLIRATGNRTLPLELTIDCWLMIWVEPMRPLRPWRPKIRVDSCKSLSEKALCVLVSGDRRVAALLAMTNPGGTRAGRVESAPNKPNPGRGDLGIDDGLGIIDDLGQGNRGHQRRATRQNGAPNKANFPAFWPENEGAAKDKASLPVREQPVSEADFLPVDFLTM